MKRAALYARVSKADQHPEAQTTPLVAYARARAMNLVPDGESLVFVDHGVSGAKTSRPALDRLMALVRSRQVNAVVAVKLDRLARSVRHLLDLAGELQALGVDLILVDQGIDTSTPAGRMTFTILGAIAEFERELIRERTLAGMEAARRKGRLPGNRPIVTPELRERIRRLTEAGKSVSEVAKAVGISRSPVGREMRRLRTGAA